MNFINELRSNYRLRIGLTVIAGIVWLSLLLDLRELNSVSLDRYRQIASQLARFNAQQKQTQWIARAQDAKDALSIAESQIWQEPTLGLTQAELRDWLLRQLLHAKATQYAVKVSESGGDRDGNKNSKSNDSVVDLIPVRAKVEFNANPASLNSFLSELANAEHKVVVESLSVKLSRTEMTVVSWYKLQPVVRVSSSSSSEAAR
jgi:hypothetical protein